MVCSKVPESLFSLMQCVWWPANIEAGDVVRECAGSVKPEYRVQEDVEFLGPGLLYHACQNGLCPC